jgi:CRP-like cAMP-binding protein
VTTEGQGGVGFFVIEDGAATVTVGGEQRRKLGSGDYFGEMALIDDSPRSATIVADSDLRCWGLTSWEFRPLVEQNASIAWAMLQTMAKRLRD